LAVEIATHLGQTEIISADSMQIYRGLDTITNKVTPEEMQDVPHHLMSFLEPEQDAEYDVGSFVRDADKSMADMADRGVLPVIVGGTTYYLQHLVLPGRLVSVPSSGDEKYDDDRPVTAQEQKTPSDVAKIAQEACSVPLEAEQLSLLLRIAALSHSATLDDVDPMMIWKLLYHLDEPMARRWHFRDTRKIVRSIKVLIETGKRHSDLIEEQQQHFQADKEGDQGEEGTKLLILHLECDRQVLNSRLDLRVEKMIEVSLRIEEDGVSES
jgi:tRNA A37 N6-isopentenylltransferase MiaA